MPVPKGKEAPNAGGRPGAPDSSKKIFSGQVAKKVGEIGFIACEETKAIYHKDVYMWKHYFGRCQIGDYVKFQIHISDKGEPQVCWLEPTEPAWPQEPPQLFSCQGSTGRWVGMVSSNRG